MIKHIIKWAFVKNLSVRTTAQIVILKLIEKFNLIDDYQLIYENIKYEHETTQNGRTKKWCPMQDFRLNHIDCGQLLNSVYVLREIPRLTQMSNDEIYYECEMLSDYNEKLIIDVQPINAREHNERLDMETDIGAGAGATGPPENCAGGDGIKNTQKKIVPLKQTFVDGELLNSLPIDMQLSLEVCMDSN